MTSVARKILCVFTLMALLGTAMPQAIVVGSFLCIPCIATLGAAALGAAALAAGLGRRRRGRKQGHRRFGHRRGRSAIDFETEMKPSVMEDILLKDDSACARRLVCELKGRDPLTLSEWERLILVFVGSPEDVPAGDKGAAWQQFLEAENLGSFLYGDCSVAFPSCPHDGNTIMGAVTKMTTVQQGL